MYFVGVDFVWVGCNLIGVVVVDVDGCLVGVGVVCDDVFVLVVLWFYVVGDCLVVFDVLLVVVNCIG